MPPEVKKIFKKFYQIGRSEDMSAKGTGLGLAICQGIIESFGGSIGLERPEWDGDPVRAAGEGEDR